jgi:hypothetical protein
MRKITAGRHVELRLLDSPRFYLRLGPMIVMYWPHEPLLSKIEILWRWRQHKWFARRSPGTADGPGEYVVYCKKCGLDQPASGDDIPVVPCIR